MRRKILIIFFCLAVGSFAIFKICENAKKEKLEKSVVVLSMKASGGHDAAAKAIKMDLESRGVPTKILYIDDYDYFGASSIYDFCMRTTAGRSLMNLCAKLYWKNAENYTYIAYKLFAGNALSNDDPICFISVVPFAYKVLQDLNKKINVPLFIVPTDMYNVYSKYWISGDNVEYILGSPHLMQSAQDKKKHEVSGMVLRREFVNDVKTREERREELGISDSRDLVIVMFGASASDKMEEIMIKVIDKGLHVNYNFAFIAGKNAPLKERLEKMKLKHNIDCIILGFENRIHAWMQAAKILIGKPGPGVISECHASKLPMILIITDIMKQEEGNVHIVGDTAVCIDHVDKIPSAIDHITQNREKFEASFESLPKNNAVDEISEIVIKNCFDLDENESEESDEYDDENGDDTDTNHRSISAN